MKTCEDCRSYEKCEVARLHPEFPCKGDYCPFFEERKRKVILDWLIIAIFIVFIILLIVNTLSCGTEDHKVVKRAACESKVEYKLFYRTIYDDLTGKEEWVTVSKAEYDKYKANENRGG